ncbi:RagB/SusD family nutrient uptake outer membrane protein [Arachidicoccus terrestris]|uniref:RagB/SusD family nutrient uptake outer membrane protein n=1 Tax=Arachidicoccus terrestris TaxID=2875539 RepID=UPI001CC4F76F|nr:RagB/SusD family nutrient uptake outer membrane protein [Arachidicoccus terrestris]UAY55735.1 RagB/SusD family nutrient uptake outer membrane protein [Arachidicoccus terrestris]
MLPFNIKRIFLYIILSAFLLAGCSKFIDVDTPYTSTSASQVFSGNAPAAAALTAIYMQLSTSDIRPAISFKSLLVDCSLYADELATADNSDQTPNAFYTNQLTPLIGPSSEWNDAYNKIYEVNAAIEGLMASVGVKASVKQQLLGEAYFVRGFFYFYMTNMFGDVPLALSTDYKANSTLSRASSEDVYAQMFKDFNRADSLLSDDYLGGDAQSVTTERVRPTKAAAETMLARLYLYEKKYADAETFATKVINRTGTYGLVALDSVFLENSEETIWSIPPIRTGTQANTAEGRLFVVSATNNIYGPAYQIAPQLLNSFESGDNRKSHWIGYALAGSGWWYFPFKYKIGADNVPRAEYSMVLRLAELYLIRAEARAMQNNISGAQDDINAIRHRAGLGNTTANTQDALVTAILHERYVELFTEWGQRFFDLKRLGKLDAILGAEKPGYWNTDDQYFPIPQTEREANPNLTQNPGYN